MSAAGEPRSLDRRRSHAGESSAILGAGTMTTKDTVRALLDRLPDDCTLEDVQYHLYVTQAVASGEADREAGRTLSHGQVEAEMRRKWLVGAR